MVRLKSLPPTRSSRPPIPRDEPATPALGLTELLGAIPRRTVEPARLTTKKLDPRAAFLFGLIDGRATLETVLDASGLPRAVAFDLVGELVRLGFVSLD